MNCLNAFVLIKQHASMTMAHSFILMNDRLVLNFILGIRIYCYEITKSLVRVDLGSVSVGILSIDVL